METGVGGGGVQKGGGSVGHAGAERVCVGQGAGEGQCSPKHKGGLKGRFWVCVRLLSVCLYFSVCVSVCVPVLCLSACAFVPVLVSLSACLPVHVCVCVWCTQAATGSGISSWN